MKRNKLLALIALFSISFSTFGNTLLSIDNTNKYTVYAEENSQSETDFEFDSETKTIKKYKGNSTNVVIPDSINGVTVEIIGKQSFRNSKIVSLTLNEGLKVVEEGAFGGSKALQNITFPSTLKRIEKMAFLSTKVESITLNEGLEYLGQRAFSNCTNLTNVKLPNSLKQISDLVFEKTNINHDIVFGSNLGHIGHRVFTGVKNNINLSLSNEGEKIYFHDELFLTEQNSLNIPQNREIMIFARSFLNSGNIALDCGTIEVNSNESKDDIQNKLNEAIKLTSGFAIIDKSGNMENDIYVETDIQWNLDDLDLSLDEIAVNGIFKTIPDEKYEGSSQNKDTVETAISKLKPIVKLKVKKIKENWTQDDFTFKVISNKLISSNEYFAITGLTEKGENKLKNNKDLIIPSYIETVENGNTIRKDITGIAENAFKDKGLTSVSFSVPDKYKEFIIDDNAFLNNNLTEIEIPYGVKFIEAFAFKGNKIKKLSIPETVKKLGSESFANNVIEELNVSDQVEGFQFDNYSFANNNLKVVNLPYSIFKLLENVFYNNTGESDGKVLLQSRNPKHFDVSTYIKPKSDYHRFENVSPDINRAELQSKLELLKNFVKEDYTDDSWNKLEKVYEKAKLTHLNHKATQIQIDQAVAEINIAIEDLVPKGANKKALIKNIDRLKNLSELLYTEESFTNLKKEIEKAQSVVNKENATQEEVDMALSNLFAQEAKLVIRDDAKYSVEDFNFENNKITGFSKSGENKFEYNKNLVIPDKNSNGDIITEISDSAFEYTKNDYIYKTDTGYSPNGLDSVIIPKTVKRIGAKAFKNHKLTEVSLPDGLEYIGDLAFNGNIIKDVTIPDSVTEIGNGAFSLNRIATAKLPKGIKTIPNGIFSRNITLTEIEIPHGVEIIGDSAFIGCALKKLTLPDTVKTIKSRAFSSSRIEELVIPASVEKIESQAFASNKKFRHLKSVILTEGLKEIGSNAFKSCLIEEIHIPNSLEVLASDAFNDNLNANKDETKTKVYTNNPDHIEKFKSTKYELIYIEVDTDELKLEIQKAKDIKNSDLYKYSSTKNKENFDKILEIAIELANNPISQIKVKEVINDLKNSISSLDGVKPNIVIPNTDNTNTADDIVQKNTFINKENKWYYKDKNGEFVKSQWVPYENKWYYLHSNGVMAENQWIFVDGLWYFADSTGKILQNQWFMVNNKWYFANKSGRVSQNEWIFYGNKWYFASENCDIVTENWREIKKEWYYFNNNGEMLANTSISGYRLNHNGQWIRIVKGLCYSPLLYCIFYPAL